MTHISLIEPEFSIEQYNSHALHPLQTWEWGEARKKMGIQVVRFAEYSKDQLENVYQMTIHPIPHTSYTIGYIPRSNMPSKHVLEFIGNYTKRHKIIFVKFEPDITKSQYPISNFQTNFNFQTTNFQFLRSVHPLFPEWTMVLGLTQTEDELFKNLKSKTRYNIRLAQKKGVVVREESNEKGFEIFSKLYFETCKRQHYYGHTPEYHKIVWNILKQNMAHILVAYYNEIPLATYELFYFNKILYYPYGGTSDQHRNVMAANLLMWEAIRFGKQKGAETFDMWGSLSDHYDPNHAWAGFTKFKEGYNSQFIQMVGSYDLIVNPTLYKIYNLVHSLRNKALGI